MIDFTTDGDAVTFVGKTPTTRILELGGGDAPHFQADVVVDVRATPRVHFQVDLERCPWPIGSADFDVVYGHFVLEHLSFPLLPAALREACRVLRPGGRALFAVPNTSAQIEWLLAHPAGWDGKDFFAAASELLFGSQAYPAGCHKVYFNHAVAQRLFQEAGFADVLTSPYGARKTDLLIAATKPAFVQLPAFAHDAPLSKEAARQLINMKNDPDVTAHAGQELPAITEAEVIAARTALPPEQAFDKEYFNGGRKVGGYAHEGYQDFPCHHVTAKHVLERKPASVLELGCARGYVLKKIQDAGVPAAGLEVSKHCYLTRACDDVVLQDLCRPPWKLHGTVVGLKNERYDLCFSVAVLEHIPEAVLPAVVREMAETCKRGLHGVDFGGRDDGFDRTHCTLKPQAWWQEQFAKHAPGWPVEVVDKESLEAGPLPPEVLTGDGKLKLNVGSFTTQMMHGWVNLDIHDLGGWSAHHGYRFQRCDVRQGLPYGTGAVDLIFCCHMLEHLSYEEGLKLLREFRRVIKPDGAVRLVVPDAAKLLAGYVVGDGRYAPVDLQELADYAEISDGVAAAPTDAVRLWELLLGGGHQAIYDAATLLHYLDEAGFGAGVAAFRTAYAGTPRFAPVKQILRECVESHVCLSLAVDCVPLLG